MPRPEGLTDPTVGLIMGKTAEVLVKEFGVSRTEQDEYALNSTKDASARFSDSLSCADGLDSR